MCVKYQHNTIHYNTEKRSEENTIENNSSLKRCNTTLATHSTRMYIGAKHILLYSTLLKPNFSFFSKTETFDINTHIV